jgi:hypothetical protein
MKQTLKIFLPVMVIGTGCGSDPISVDPDSIAGTWDALTYAYLETADLTNVVELIGEGASYTITFTSSGSYTSSFRHPTGEIDSESGTYTVSPQDVIALLASGETEPVLFFATREEDRMSLETGLAEWDFDQDGTPEPAQWRIFLGRDLTTPLRVGSPLTRP